MKTLHLFFMLTCIVVLVGCANHIKYVDAVIWDSVPGTDRVSLDEQRIEGGLVQAKVRFVCQKRQYLITNEYFTAYRGSEEWVEVPVGLVTLPFSAAWWLVASAVSLFTAPIESAAKPLYWSAAGLNPGLNVEWGMFEERYSIQEKPGSRKPQKESPPEPYDAVLPPLNGMVEAWFDGGGVILMQVGEEVLLTVNLIEVARVMPTSDSQKLLLEVTLSWNPDTDPVLKEVAIFLDKPLAERLYALKNASHTLMTTQDPTLFENALEKVEKAGFSREAAMIKDKRKGELFNKPVDG